MKKKLHIKRFTLLAAVLLALAISFTGCGKDSSNSDSKAVTAQRLALRTSKQLHLTVKNSHRII